MPRRAAPKPPDQSSSVDQIEAHPIRHAACGRGGMTRILSRDGGFAGDETTACHYHCDGMLASLGILGGVDSLLGMRVLGP